MLDAIASLGKLQYSDNPQQLMHALVRFTRAKPQEVAHYMIMDFSTTSRKLTLQIAVCNETPDSPGYTPRKLNYVGIVPASGLQFHATNHDLRHLCSQVLPALLDKLPAESKLRGSIVQVLSDYFLLDMNNLKDRYRYLLDLEAAGVGAPDLSASIMATTPIKERPAAVAKALLDGIKTTQQVTPEQLRLFALSINGQFIAQYPDYVQAVLTDQVSMFAKANQGICYLTGQKAQVSADLTKFKFKYYITDKLNFSSRLTGKFEHNFQLSEAGVWQLLLGERYIMNRLRLRIGSFNVYMIPEFLNAEAYDEVQVRKTINRVYQDVKEVASLKEVRNIEEGLNKELRVVEELSQIQTQMLINLLFYEENKNEMKVYRHIKDVSPSRITMMLSKTNDTRQYFSRIAPHFRANKPSLESMYYLIPLQVDSKGKVKNPQILMQLYDSILTGRLLNRRELIEAFMALLARVNFQTTGGLQIAKRSIAGESGSENAWIRLIWEQVQAIYWLEEIGNLQRSTAASDLQGNREDGEEAQMTIELLTGLEKEQAHIQASGFGKAKASLFLLGGAIKMVADAQNASLNSRPILQKLNFRGMSYSNLQRVVSEIFEKALYYRKDPYFPGSQFDKYYAEMKRLLDLAEQEGQDGKIGLSDSETVFYILSGYSYRVGTSFKARKNDNGDAAEGQPSDGDIEDADNEAEEEENDNE